MPWTNTTIHSIFNTYLRAQAFTSPGTIYLGLATALPTNAGSFTEVTNAQWTYGAPNNYQRFLITIGSAPASRSVTNSVACVFATAATNVAAPFSVSYGGIFDEQTVGTGTFMAWGALATPLLIGVGTLVSIPAGALTITDMDPP